MAKKEHKGKQQFMKTNKTYVPLSPKATTMKVLGSLYNHACLVAVLLWHVCLLSVIRNAPIHCVPPS